MVLQRAKFVVIISIIPYNLCISNSIACWRLAVVEINNVQDKNKSLIETHLMNMCSFLWTLLIYNFAYFAAMKFKLQIFKAIAVMS